MKKFKPLNNEIKSSRNNKVHQHKDKPKKLVTSPSSTLIIDHLMIPYHCLNDLTKLGRGQFGEVLSGKATDVDLPHALINSSGVKENGNGGVAANGKSNDLNEIQAQQFVNVLIKSMSKLKDESHFVEFRRQIDLYRAVDSSHVVRLLALSFEKDHHFMILEHHRDLKGYLMEQRDKATLQQLIQFSLHVARGLDAIAKSKLTHR
jgi:serine/threonine protein kinase